MVEICKPEDGEILDGDERSVEDLIKCQEGRSEKVDF